MSQTEISTGFVARLTDAGQWTLEGELDCESAPEMVSFARAAPTPHVGLFVWVHDLRFIDGAGWSALREAHETVGWHRSMQLIGSRSAVRLVVDVLGAP